MDEYFDLSRPGRYTVLVSGAKPITFNVRKPGSKGSEATSRLSVYRAGDPFEKQWQDALGHRRSASRRPRSGIRRFADRPRAVNLVVSLRNVCTSGKIAPGWAYSVSGEDAAGVLSSKDSSPGTDVKVGTKASDYRILVQDVSGKAVFLTDEGKKWLAAHKFTWIRPLRPGEAIGFVCPLHENVRGEGGSGVYCRGNPAGKGCRRSRVGSLPREDTNTGAGNRRGYETALRIGQDVGKARRDGGYTS